MIIDSHVHFGSTFGFPMPKKDVLLAMEKYNISKALVSNCESVECDFDQKPLPENKQIPLIVSAKNTLDFAKNNEGKIYAAIWIKPLHEQPSTELEYLIRTNLKYIKALKVHPYHSATAFDDPKLEEYIELAEHYKLPIICHTATDPCSECRHVYEVAKRHPGINFIMAHLGLGTDNVEATDMCAQLPNLYGDTAWVPIDSAVRFIDKCGSHKLMFGSDMPIDGLDTYAKNRQGKTSMYVAYFKNLENKISSEAYEALMWKNALNFYNLE